MTHSEDPLQQPNRTTSLGSSSRRGFPLSLLFLLMALFAIPLAMLGAVANETFVGGSDAAERAGAMIILMSITGVVIGAHHYRRFSGMVMGSAIGTVFGVLSAPLVGASAQTTPRLLAMACVGAVVLVVFSYTLRALSKTPPEPNAMAEAHPLDTATHKDAAPKDIG